MDAGSNESGGGGSDAALAAADARFDGGGLTAESDEDAGVPITAASALRGSLLARARTEPVGPIDDPESAGRPEHAATIARSGAKVRSWRTSVAMPRVGNAKRRVRSADTQRAGGGSGRLEHYEILGRRVATTTKTIRATARSRFTAYARMDGGGLQRISSYPSRLTQWPLRCD